MSETAKTLTEDEQLEEWFEQIAEKAMDETNVMAARRPHMRRTLYAAFKIMREAADASLWPDGG